MHLTETHSQSSEEQCEQPTQSQLIGSLEAKSRRRCLKTCGKEILQVYMKVPAPRTGDCICHRSTEESQINDFNTVAPSLPRAEKSQIHLRGNLYEKVASGIKRQ